MPKRKLPRYAESSLRFAVIIPARNEQESITDTVKSILLSGVKQSNIYIISDGSTDRTVHIAQDLGVNVIINETNLGKAPSLKKALDVLGATGRYEVACFIDADTRVDSNYFHHVSSEFEAQDDIVMVIGRVTNDNKTARGFLQATRAHEYAVQNNLYRPAQSKMSTIFIAPGCTIAIRLRIVPDLTFDNETLAEDMRMAIEIHRKNLGKITYATHAFVYTKDPLTFSAYKKQIERWSIGGWQNIKKFSMPFGGQRIDFMMMVLYGEQFLWLLCIPYAGWQIWDLLQTGRISLLLYLLFISKCIQIILVLMSARSENRYDILLYSPFFFITKITNAVIMVYTCISIIIFEKPAGDWFQPPRTLGGPSEKSTHQVS